MSRHWDNFNFALGLGLVMEGELSELSCDVHLFNSPL